MGNIEFDCPHCGVRLSFAAAQAGASGPCYRCGTTVVVPTPAIAAAPSIPPAAPSLANADLEIAPSALHHKILAAATKEATKSQLQVLGMRVLQIGQKVARGENFGAALWGGQIRVDQVQAIKIRSGRGPDFFLIVPWSGAMTLAHEMASVLPRGLPCCLRLSRGALGSWSEGRYEGSNGGQRDPVALAAEPEHKLHDGIVWDWESGRLRIKLHWGLQAVPFDVGPQGPRTLHVVHTAELGVLFREYGLRWYLDRQLAFAQFVQKQAYVGPPPPRLWNPAPLTAFFLADLAG